MPVIVFDALRRRSVHDALSAHGNDRAVQIGAVQYFRSPGLRGCTKTQQQFHRVRMFLRKTAERDEPVRHVRHVVTKDRDTIQTRTLLDEKFHQRVVASIRRRVKGRIAEDVARVELGPTLKAVTSAAGSHPPGTVRC